MDAFISETADSNKKKAATVTIRDNDGNVYSSWAAPPGLQLMMYLEHLFPQYGIRRQAGYHTKILIEDDNDNTVYTVTYQSI